MQPRLDSRGRGTFSEVKGAPKVEGSWEHHHERVISVVHLLHAYCDVLLSIWIPFFGFRLKCPNQGSPHSFGLLATNLHIPSSHMLIWTINPCTLGVPLYSSQAQPSCRACSSGLNLQNPIRSEYNNHARPALLLSFSLEGGHISFSLGCDLSSWSFGPVKQRYTIGWLYHCEHTMGLMFSLRALL